MVTPTISGFSPTSGGTGKSVTITGTNFTGATAVSFGGTAEGSFTVSSNTSITTVVDTGTSPYIAAIKIGIQPAANTGYEFVDRTCCNCSPTLAQSNRYTIKGKVSNFRGTGCINPATI